MQSFRAQDFFNVVATISLDKGEKELEGWPKRFEGQPGNIICHFHPHFAVQNSFTRLHLTAREDINCCLDVLQRK